MPWQRGAQSDATGEYHGNRMGIYASMGKLKGKILTGNHRYSHEIGDFPVIFPLNQSIEWTYPENIGISII